MVEINAYRINVLDNGFVQRVAAMGDDASVVQAARISYGSGTKKVSEDRELIRYLMRNNHLTPFEMVEFKFYIRIPMDIWRQMVRHRTASINEYSTRYSEAIDTTHEIYNWQYQSTNNKQGSGESVDKALRDKCNKQQEEIHALCKKVYAERLADGISREQARKDLPLCTYTEACWKIDLRNLLHFLHLRLDMHAQSEIRAYAEAILYLISPIVPVTIEAFKDYVLNAITFSVQEQRFIRHSKDMNISDKIMLLRSKDSIESIDGRMTVRERNDLADKLESVFYEKGKN